MRNLLLLLLLTITFVSCKEKNSNPQQLSPAEQESFKYAVSRYINKAPKDAEGNKKFDAAYDNGYRIMAQKNDLLHYYKDDKTGTVYFAIAKIAPSLKLKKVATGGKLKFDAKGEIAAYEEVFRTWKMEEGELKQKTALLFKKFIDGEDLSPYYTKNANGESYIEFPDENTYYDKNSRGWKTKLIIP
ncbi:hypothetical protein CHU92_07375 [Flavobacterium cyanobacteriorum]|uniref:Lipoprotein n=1 Tax=Flavobacterium cyanobacteriorum TaxID=2022802 RepID=A0A255ZAD5_9FLAO|nr:hypothetical protein [Flavobacterium cyanobacteriorum]OYQ37854.1 hypothetical protein CHU92_07375 [Flavobacterium cyanobacteriorum]